MQKREAPAARPAQWSTSASSTFGASQFTPFQTPMRRVLERLRGVRKTGSGFSARCSLHDDHRPSLSIREGRDGAVLVHCFGGCSTADVVAAIGLQMGDLFARQSPAPATALRHLRSDPMDLYSAEIKRARSERVAERPWSSPKVLVSDVNTARDRINRANGSGFDRLAVPDIESDFPMADDPLWDLCVDRAVIEKFAGIAPIDWGRAHWRRLPNTRNAVLDRAAVLLHQIGRAAL